MIAPEQHEAARLLHTALECSECPRSQHPGACQSTHHAGSLTFEGMEGDQPENIEFWGLLAKSYYT